ncbi:MAG TPA: tripartite tricarboxylate transporter TctB family protein [Candidatus Limnocylindrales bacterium]|nr:tripartite tricarboxylate transporter TctB family protein [Candidatus Limnocylindrales bacterium]
MTDLPEDDPPPATTTGRLIAAAVPLIVGAAALVNSILLGVGSLTDPGAGLWPAGASCLMILGSVLLLPRLRSMHDGERFGGVGLRTIGLSLVFAGVFVILFGGMGSWPGTGFEWATALMLALWLKLIGGESWLMTAAVSVGVTAGLHLLFIELLKAPIPHTIG